MTSEHRGPKPCHYDRTLSIRVTREHRDDCPKGRDCPGERGCAPCTAPHCSVCGRNHATNEMPETCAECLGKIRGDLIEIRDAHQLLAIEAIEAGADGHLVAAAPIPGGTAQVLIGPSVRIPLLRTYAGYTDDDFHEDHRRGDPLPPLAVLAQWEDIYRAYLNHDPGHTTATITRAIGYLLDQLTYIAQQTDGPDFLEFTRQTRSLRASCERALHDEQEPEDGVECFECGDKLVRRFRRPTKCIHPTPARDYVRYVVDELGYPEHLDRSELRAIRLPCGSCSQGGIDDPTAGLSWECPGCRKSYDPGEYATAVRRDLLDRGDEGDGWTHVSMAADAATTLVGMPIAAGTIRKWIEREKVSACCLWEAKRLPDGSLRSVPWGQRLVYWPDVADEAVEAVHRAHLAAEAKRQRAERKAEEAAEEEAKTAAVEAEARAALRTVQAPAVPEVEQLVRAAS